MLSRQPVNSLKGIGEKTGKPFEKLGVVTIDDLLAYYPRAYDAHEAPVPIGQLKEQTIMAMESALVRGAGLVCLGHMQIVSVQLRDLTGFLQVSWYNMPYMRVNLKAGVKYVFWDRVVKKRGRMIMGQPEIFTLESYEALAGPMQLVCGQTRGLSNKTTVRVQRMALEVWRMEREYMPSDLRRRYELAEINYAMEHTHFLADQIRLLFARKRLVSDKFFMFLAGVRRLKEHREGRYSTFMIKEAKEVTTFQSSLPYVLTRAQERALREVYDDMGSGLVMDRLIQGDVGSGKVTIAILALLQVAYNGYQGALTVLTEALTRQHFESITSLFEKQGIEKVPVLVIDSMTAKERRLVYTKTASHEADIIVDTHTLTQEKVVYNNLVLAITDKQHRFGVGQRELFSSKGQESHMLVMSATPTPRTLATTPYGDLDISVIDELLAGRQTIKNCVVDPGYRPEAYTFIERQVAEGHQAYVICPMMEESEMVEAENVLDYTKVLKEALPPSIIVEYPHGGMKGKEKNVLMERFAAGEIHVSVSTIVIKVGVNMPNTTVMMIESAERFGLVQLHQLRGRVGRGKNQSYCIMVNCPRDEGAGERLGILSRSNDGFYIASEDLKLRGPGDILDLRQSGDMEFKLAGIFTDTDVLKKISEEVNRLLDADPGLEKDEHRELKRKVEEYLGTNYEELNLQGILYERLYQELLYKNGKECFAMNETLNMTLTRRSIRKFSNKPIPEDEMELTVQAALHVPSGMGFQTWQFMVVRNREKIQMSAAAIEKTLDCQGYDMYQPRVLVISFNEKEGRFGREDDVCAMENTFLAAHSLGIDSAWVNQFQGICDESAIRQILTSFGVPPGHVVYGMVALGYAANTKADKARTGKVIYVDWSAYAQVIYV